MRTFALLSLLNIGVLAHPSGLWWGTDTCYPSPENTDNSCLGPQQSGFDWSQLANGDNWSFEGFKFDGFSARDVCGASGGKCIAAKLSQDDSYAVKVEATQAPFSVQKFHLSTSRDTLLMLNYEMADGSYCHQLASSSPEGVDVVNQQCGGAVSVEFTLPEDSKFGECDLSIHQMDFDCSKGTKPPGHLPPPPSPSPSSAQEVPSVVPENKPSITSDAWTEPDITSGAWIEPSITSKAWNKPSSTPEASTVWKTMEVTVTNCPPTVTDCPAHSTVISTYTTSTTVCPSSLPAVSTSSIPPVINSRPPAITTSPGTPGAPVVPVSCPNLLPKCMNTWLTIPKCHSNSDAACFCPSSEFTEKVEACIHAWGESEKEKDSALSYFAGICAPYIPKNPDIIGLVPTTSVASSQISQPQPRPTNSAASAPPSWASITAPATAPTSPLMETPCTTVTWASHTVTVPKVGFSTVPAGSTTSVVLVIPTSSTAPAASATSLATTSHCSKFKTITTVVPCDCETSLPTHPATAVSPAVTPSGTSFYSNSGSKLSAGYLLTIAFAFTGFFI